MNENNKINHRKTPIVVFVLTGIVLLFILCVCTLLVLFLVYGPELIYIL